MRSKALWLVLLASLTWPASHFLCPARNNSACLQGNGTDGVTLWQNAIGRAPDTSESGHRVAFAAGVTSISSPSAIESFSPPGEGWPVVLTCAGMTAFVLFIILRRLRRDQGLDGGSRRPEVAGSN